jgi:Protein of unknown function (DUF2807).
MSFCQNVQTLKNKNMKNLKYFTVIFLCLAITACVDGQFRKAVYGNRNVVKKNRPAGSFTGVKVSTGIDLYLTQGDKMSIEVEADENLHEYIITEIKGEQLYIRVDDGVNIREAERKRVYVTMKEIKSLSTSSAGDIIGETPVKTDDLKLDASSAGDIKLEVYAKNIRVDGSSSGDITLDGEADMIEADLSSAGDLNAYNLKTREADISVSSAGDADVYVTEKLTARASSAGDINYKGDPKYVDAHASSAGGIHRK